MSIAYMNDALIHDLIPKPEGPEPEHGAITFLREEFKKLQDRISSLAARVEHQSDLLSRKAEK